MNKFNSIIYDSLRCAQIKPSRLGFIDLRYNACLRAKASGMARYYKVAERAFRKPETAKKALQYLLTNLSAMICENVYIAHAISERGANITARNQALKTIYEIILGDRKIIDVQGIKPSGVELFRSGNDRSRDEKIVNLYAWHKEVMREVNITGCSDAFTLAGLFQYAVLWKPDYPKARPGDPTAICSKLLKQYVYPIEEARRKDPSDRDNASRTLGNNLDNCRELTDFVFKLRNDIVHHNLVPKKNDIPLSAAFVASIEEQFPAKYDADQMSLLVCIAMTIAMPYVVGGLLNDPQLTFSVNWLAVCPPLWAKWKGDFPEYPVVDPVLGSNLAPASNKREKKSKTKKSGRKGSAIGFSLGYIFHKSLQIAFLVAIAVFIRALVHNWSGRGFNGYTSSEQIHDYVESMNNYDRALLMKERKKFLKKHPTLFNEQRENELSRRYSDEKWPETSFTRTVWHIGTPRWMHIKQSAKPSAEAEATAANSSDKSNSSSIFN